MKQEWSLTILHPLVHLLTDSLTKFLRRYLYAVVQVEVHSGLKGKSTSPQLQLQSEAPPTLRVYSLMAVPHCLCDLPLESNTAVFVP